MFRWLKRQAAPPPAVERPRRKATRCGLVDWCERAGSAIVIERSDEELGVEVVCFIRGNVTEKDALRKAELALRDRRGSSTLGQEPADESG